MSCSKTGSSGLLYCRCGESFCSEASFIKAWHAGHKKQCPHATQLLSEASTCTSTGRKPRRSGASAQICHAALSRTKPSEQLVCDLPDTGGSASQVETERNLLDRPCLPTTSDKEEVRNAAERADMVSIADSARSTSFGASSQPRSSHPNSFMTESARSAYGLLADFIPVGDAIGAGSFGKVHKVLHGKTGDTYALKVISKTRMAEHKMLQHIHREMRLQQQLRHPHIIRLYHGFEEEEAVHLLLEYASEGSLFRMLRGKGGLSEPEAAPIFIGIAGALDYLHGHELVHRDVKPDNVLLCRGHIAKLADFGFCAELGADRHRKTFCGTWDYLSPEMIDRKPHNHAVDVWAMGVLLYEMLVGRAPFASKSQASRISRIVNADVRIPSSVSPEACDVIHRLLVIEPEQRLPLADAIRHTFATQQASLGTWKQPVVGQIRRLPLTEVIGDSLASHMISGNTCEQQAKFVQPSEAQLFTPQRPAKRKTERLNSVEFDLDEGQSCRNISRAPQQTQQQQQQQRQQQQQQRRQRSSADALEGRRSAVQQRQRFFADALEDCRSAALQQRQRSSADTLEGYRSAEVSFTSHGAQRNSRDVRSVSPLLKRSGNHSLTRLEEEQHVDSSNLVQNYQNDVAAAHVRTRKAAPLRLVVSLSDSEEDGVKDEQEVALGNLVKKL